VGTLDKATHDFAERLARTALPREPGLIALPAGPTPGIDVLYCLPLAFPRGAPWGALALHGAGVEEVVRPGLPR